MVMRSPGVFEAILSLPPEATLGDELTLSASGSACKVTLEAFTAARMALSLSDTAYVAGTGAAIIVTVTLSDLGGRPARAVIDLTTDNGAVSSLSMVAPGVYTARWQVADRFASKQRAFITARTRALSAERVLLLEAGRAKTLVLTALPAALDADGRSGTAIVATVNDVHGNGVRRVRLAASAHGKVTPFVWDAQAQSHRARYTTPSSYDLREDVLLVRDDASDLQSRVRLPLIPRQRVWLLGPKVGVSANFKGLLAPYAGFEVARRLHGILNRLMLGLDAGTLVALTDVTSSEGERIVGTVWAVPILAKLRMGFIVDRWELQGFAGVGVSIVGADVNGDVAGRASSVNFAFAFSPGLGAAVWVGPGQIALDVAYWYTRAGGVVQGQLGGLLVTAGYRFGL